MLFPTEVELNEEKIRKLNELYLTAQKRIESELLHATDFGAFRRRQILSQIDKIVEGLQLEINGYLQKELPFFYKQGAKDAVKQLKKIGAGIETSSGFSLIHQEAVKILIDDTAKAFAESMTGMKRSANAVLNQAVKQQITQQIAMGKITGESLKDTKDLVAGIIQNKGINSLIDKGGRPWTLDRYSEMLIRTKTVEARNRGLVNRMAENGYDLVEVTSNGTTCQLCAPWEGKILSVSGNDPDYPALSEAEADGLFHPNCQHAINAIHLDLVAQIDAYNLENKNEE